MISKGIVLIDNNERLLQLKKYAITLKNAGPKPINLQLKKTILFKCYNLYDDLEDDKDWNEIIFIAMELFNSLVLLNSMHNSYWTSSGKWKYKYLSLFDQEFAKNLTDCFVTLIKTNNKSYFLNFVKKNISNYGNRPNQFTSRHHTCIIQNNTLTISIITNSNIKDVYEIYLSEIYNQLKIYSNSINLCYVYNDGSYLDCSNYFVFIQGENEILNHIVSPIVKSFIKKKQKILIDKNIISTLNYFVEPKSLVLNDNVYKHIRPLLVHFNKIHEWIGSYNENKILILIIQFHLCIGSKLGFSIEEYIHINKYIFDKWISFTIDSNRINSFNILEESRKIKVQQYREIFEFQKSTLIQNFSPIHQNWNKPSFDFLEKYISDGIALISTFYNESEFDFFLPQFKLSSILQPISDFDKKRLISLESVLNLLYSSVLLSSDQKSYLVYTSYNLLEIFKARNIE